MALDRSRSGSVTGATASSIKTRWNALVLGGRRLWWVPRSCPARPELYVPTTDHGSYAADLRAFLEPGFTMANQTQTADLLRGLMLEAQTSQNFGKGFRTTFLQPRREAFAAITDGAARRGDLAPPRARQRRRHRVRDALVPAAGHAAGTLT